MICKRVDPLFNIHICRVYGVSPVIALSHAFLFWSPRCFGHHGAVLALIAYPASFIVELVCS